MSQRSVWPRIRIIGSHSMRRPFLIVCTLIVFAFFSSLYGCSSSSNPSQVPHAGAVGIQRTPQSKGSWTTRAPMPTARVGLAAVVVNNILYTVGGGSAVGGGNKLEAYDPVTNTWTTKAPMPTARYGLAAGVINGILYA